MPIFKVNIDREVTNWDRFTRFIEAETADAAEAIAKKIAHAANEEEPESYYGKWFDDESGDWILNDIELATEKDVEDAEEDQLFNIEPDEEKGDFPGHSINCAKLDGGRCDCEGPE